MLSKVLVLPQQLQPLDSCKVSRRSLLLLQAEERRQSKASKGERPVVSIDNPVWQAIRWGTEAPPNLQPGQAHVLGLAHAFTAMAGAPWGAAHHWSKPA